MTPNLIRTFAVLPRDVRPAMPEKCVRCAAPRPDGRVTLWTMSSSWWAWLLPIVMFFQKVTRVTFPACRGCAWRIRFRRMLAAVLLIALCLSVIHLASPWFARWPGLFRRLGVGAIAIAALVPWALWQHYFPAPVTLDLEGETVRYEFRDIEFAVSFRMVNQAVLLE